MLKTTLALALVNGAMGQTPADIRWQTAMDCYQREMVAAGVDPNAELKCTDTANDGKLCYEDSFSTLGGYVMEMNQQGKCESACASTSCATIGDAALEDCAGCQDDATCSVFKNDFPIPPEPKDGNGMTPNDPGMHHQAAVECACAASGRPTATQEAEVEKTCREEADAAFTTAGGSAADLADAAANGAATASTDTWTNCYRRERKCDEVSPNTTPKTFTDANCEFKDEGTCKNQAGVSGACQPELDMMMGMMGTDYVKGKGYQTNGDACTTECTGMLTDAKRQLIETKCDSEAEQAIMKAGGNPEEFADMKFDKAAGAGADAAMGCFDTEFAAQNYKWEGTCDQGVACSPDMCDPVMPGVTCSKGWKNVEPWGECADQCTGGVTWEQQEAIHTKCAAVAQNDFVKNGGNMDDWEEAQKDGAASAGAGNMMACFDTAFAAAGYNWEGTCDGTDVCFNDGWKMNGGKCTSDCTGAVTEAEMEALHKTCDGKAKEKYISAGGNLADYEMNLEMGAANAATDGMENCFDKKFQDAGYKWEGTCETDKVCYDDGYKMMGGYCTDTCAGVVTWEQQEAIHAECDKKAKQDFISNGGTQEDFDNAMMTGASTAGAQMIENCFEDKMKAKGYSWEGTCDGTDVCFNDGWKMNGGKCTGACTGAVTQTQMDTIAMQCDEQGKKEFIKSGGSQDDWGSAMMDTAATKGVDNMANCFEKEFAAKGYKWEGTCKGTTNVCFEGGYEMDCTTPGCTCECEGVVSFEQTEAIDVKCDASSKQEFMKNGGVADEWEHMKMEGAGAAGVKSMETCVDKKMAEQKLGWEGTCDGGQVCWEGGYTMMGMCADKKCVGVATMEQMDAIHATCDEAARVKYITSGGDSETFDMHMMESAENAGVTMMDNCFDKKFASLNLKWEGTCGEDNTKICYDEDGYTMDGYICTKGCVGVATRDQLNGIQMECDKQAQKSFINGGGSADDWADARMTGAADKGMRDQENCFNDAVAKQGLKMESTCKDSATLCFEGGWTMEGTTCDCPGVITMAQIDAIHTTCANSGEQAFIKAGGNADDYGMAITEAAADAGTDMLGSCYDKEFKAAGYSWDGVCKGTAIKCWEGGWNENNEECECTGLATAAQHEAIYNVCDEKARKKYMTAGGEVLDWEMSKDDAAMEGGAKMMESCFTKAYEAANYGYEGLCKDEPTRYCLSDGSAMDGGKKCTCTGLPTDAQIEKLQSDCDAKGQKQFSISGGDTDDWDKKKMEGAVAAMGKSRKNCFTKEMENRNYKITGVCNNQFADTCKFDRVTLMSHITTVGSDRFDMLCECTGIVTPAQIIDIQDTCDKKSRKVFMTAGGHPEEYDKELIVAATKTLTATQSSCTDKMLKSKSVTLEGTCKGTTDICIAGVQLVAPYQMCDCENAATPEQLIEMDTACKKKSSDAFVRTFGQAGGSLASAYTAAAEMQMENSKEKCFKKQLKAASKTFTGYCEGAPAEPCDATSKCVCIGSATPEEIGAVHTTCEQEVMTDFVRAGGNLTNFATAKENVGIKAINTEFSACYTKREKSKLLVKNSALKAGVADLLVLTTAETDVIHAACTVKADADFVKAGGNVTSPIAFHTAANEAAADAALNMGTGCFQVLFRRNKYDHATVTPEQVMDMTMQCAAKARKSFERAGGNVTNFQVDSSRRRQSQIAATAKGCQSTGGVKFCNNFTMAYDYMDRGGMPEMADKDVVEGLATMAVHEYENCVMAENAMDNSACKFDAEESYVKYGGMPGDNFTMAFNEAKVGIMVAKVRADPNYVVPDMSIYGDQETRQIQNGAEGTIANVFSEALPGDNFTELAMDVYARSGGNVTHFHSAQENAAMTTAAQVVGACGATIMMNCDKDPAMCEAIDVKMTECDVKACTMYAKIGNFTSIDDVTAQQECASATVTGEVHRQALHTTHNQTGFEALADEIQQIRDNKDYPTEDLRDDKNNFVITYTKDPTDTVCDETATTAIGRKIGNTVGSASDCKIGTPIESPGGTTVKLVGTCVFKDVEAANKGQDDFVKMAPSFDLEPIIVAATAKGRRLGGRMTNNRQLADKMVITSSSTKSKKNCRIGQECKSSYSKMSGLSGGMIALIAIVCCVVVVALVVVLVLVVKKVGSDQRRVESFKMPKDGVVEMQTNPNPNSAIK